MWENLGDGLVVLAPRHTCSTGARAVEAGREGVSRFFQDSGQHAGELSVVVFGCSRADVAVFPFPRARVPAIEMRRPGSACVRVPVAKAVSRYCTAGIQWQAVSLATTMAGPSREKAGVPQMFA